LVGRPELLVQRAVDDSRAATLDLSRLISDPPGDVRRQVRSQDGLPDDRLADELVAAAGFEPRAAGESLTDDGSPAWEGDESLAGDGGVSAAPDERDVTISRGIDNTDRAVGATLSNRVVTSDADRRIDLRFTGTAGQSFGAFLAEGVDARLTGAANDYLGKGLSGGRLVVSTPERAGYDPSETVVVGNVALYGATRGELYVEGRAGERFAVRNSGVHAVVEGVGDHACEYMTGGTVAVLGETGRNFAAGMSGGIAYVYDPDDEFDRRLNGDNCTVGSLDETDERCLRRLLENHAAYTDSDRATALLDDWPMTREAFVRVVPDAYRRAVREGADDVRRDPPEAADTAGVGGVEPATGDD
jgi:Glutamate synthase domain 3